MDWLQVVLAALVINSIRGLSLKCGEEIFIHRGEQKVLRFWSSEDELLNVDVFSKTRGGGATTTAVGVGGGPGPGPGGGGGGATRPAAPGKYPSNTGSDSQLGSKRPTPETGAASKGDFYYAYGAKLTTLSPAAAPSLGTAGEAPPHQQRVTTTQQGEQGLPPEQQDHDSRDGSQHNGLGVNTVFSDDSIIYDFKTRDDFTDYDAGDYDDTRAEEGPSPGVGGQEDDTPTTTLAPPRQEEASYHTHLSDDSHRIDDIPQDTNQEPINDEDQDASERTTLGPQPQEASVGPTRLGPQAQEASVGPTRHRPQAQEASVGPTRLGPQAQEASVGPTRLGPQAQEASVGPTRLGPQAQEASVGPTRHRPQAQDASVETTRLGPQAQEASVGPTRLGPQAQEASVGPTRLGPQAQEASVGPTRLGPQAQEASVGPTRLGPQAQEASVGPTRLGPQAQEASVGTSSTAVANGAAGPLEQDNAQAVSTQGLPAQVKTPEQEQQQPDAGGLFTDDAEPTTDITVGVTAQDATKKPALQDKQTPDEVTAMHHTVKPASVPAASTTEAEPYTTSNAQGVVADAEDWSTADQHTADDGEESTEASAARTEHPVDGDLQTVGYDDLMITERTTIVNGRDPVTASVTEGYPDPVTSASRTEAEGNAEMSPGHTRNEAHPADGLDETTASDYSDDPHTYSTTEPEYDATQMTHIGPPQPTTEALATSAHRTSGAASGDVQTESVTKAPGIATDVLPTVEVPMTTEVATATEPAGTTAIPNNVSPHGSREEQTTELPSTTEVPDDVAPHGSREEQTTETPTTTEVPDDVVPHGSREEVTTGESVTMESTRTDHMEVAADLSQDESSGGTDTGDAGEQVTTKHPSDTGQEVLASTTDDPSTETAGTIVNAIPEASTGVRDGAEDIPGDAVTGIIGGAEFDATSDSTTEGTDVDNRDDILDITIVSGDEATEEAVTDIPEIKEGPGQATDNIREGSPIDTEGEPITYTTEAAFREGDTSDTTEVTADTTTDSEAKLDHMQDGGQGVEVTAGDVSKHEFDDYDDRDTYHFSIGQEETKETWEDAEINDDGETETTTTFWTREEPGDVGDPETIPTTGYPADVDDGLADTQFTTDNVYFQDTLHSDDWSDGDVVGATTDATTHQAGKGEDSDGNQNPESDPGTPPAAADSTFHTDPTRGEDPKPDAGGGGGLGVGGSGAASHSDTQDTPTVLKTTGSSSSSSSSDTDHVSHGDIFDTIIEQLTEDLERGSHKTREPVGPLFLDINSLLRREPTTAGELGAYGTHDAPAPQLTLGHRGTDSFFRDDPTTDDDEEVEVTTASDASTSTLAPGSFAMGGFMDLSVAAMLDDTTHSTADQTEAPTEAPSVALTTTAPAEDRTEEAPTDAPDYDYPNITDDDSFKGYDYYERLVDSLTAQDGPYKGEEGQGTTSGTVPHETDAAPDAALTTLETSTGESLATMMSTKNSAREDQDQGNQETAMTGEQVTGDSEGVTMTEGPTTEEPNPTTTSPATDGYADEVTATTDVDGDATTAFSVPLVVLRNQEMLNDLLNTQGVTGDSKVVIREQGSKVAINHPAHHHNHDAQLRNASAEASSQVNTSTAAPSETPAAVQDDTLQTNATNPEVAEEVPAAGVLQTPDTRDQDKTPATSSSAENQDSTTINTPTTSSSAENQDTTTIDDLTDLRQHQGAPQPTSATATADDVTDEGVDETTTSSAATDGTTQNPELATILIPYSFVQYLGQASGGSQGQDTPRHPVAQKGHLQSQHGGEGAPEDGGQERPLYGEGSSVHGEGSHYGEGSYMDGERRPVTDGEASPDYGEGSSAYSEKGPLQDGETSLDYGEGSSVYGEDNPLYSEGVRPVRGEAKPLYSEGIAAEGEASPGDEDSPADGEISLPNGERNPGYGEGSTVHDETRPGYSDGERLVYDALYPVNREKETEHTGARPANFGEDSPVYGVERLDYGDASVAYGDASVAYGDASVAYGDASVAYGDASLAYGEPSPQQDDSVRVGGAQSYDGQESLVYGDRLAYGEESLVYGGQRPTYGEDSVYGDGARPAYGEGSAYGDDAEPAYGEGGLAYGDGARPAYGEGSAYGDDAEPAYGEGGLAYGEEARPGYGDGARPMYGEESAGRPVYDASGNPTYDDIDSVPYGGGDDGGGGSGSSPAYGSAGGPVSGGLGSEGISRKDDAGLTDYGGEPPFFIKLPGSPNAVPVYLQYEPVQVKYVPSEQPDEHAHNASSPEGVEGVRDEATGLQERVDAGGSAEDVVGPSGTSPEGDAPHVEVESEPRENATEHDSLSATLMNGIYRILDNVAVAVNNQFSEQPGGHKQHDTDNFIPHKPIGERPDPFFLMEAPQLGEHNSHQPPPPLPQPPQLDANHTDGSAADRQREESYSVDVSGKLDFDGGKGDPERKTVGTVEDVPIGLKQEILYPGDYYSHHAYTGVNLSSLINPVFDLSTKPTTQSQEDRMNPQYTPFPITTNPPRRKTVRPVHTLLGPQHAHGEGSGSLSSSSLSSSSVKTPRPAASTESPVTKGLPSVEYSPIPAADFQDSYDASYIPEYFYEHENRLQPPTVNPTDGKDAFHGSLPPPDDTRRVSAAPYKISDDAALTLASLTSATLTAQDAAGTTTTTTTTTAALAAAAAAAAASDDRTASGSNAPPPPDQFTAHQQVWSFPQSREEPSGQVEPPYSPPHDAPTRIYSAFYSPREIPGIDPSIFGYRKVPQVQEGGSAPVYTYDLPQAQEEVPTAQAGGPNPDPAHHALLGPQFFKYLNSLPYALLRKFLDPADAKGATPPHAAQERLKRAAAGSRSGRQILCEWNVKTEPGLYLLMTFHNLSAPYTVDCHGAYIEVERENNGYDARWCGNRVYQAGTRPHVIFAKTEVRINVFDDGDTTKSLPTGFESDIEVIDLFNAEDYDAFMKSSAYPHIRRLLLG